MKRKDLKPGTEFYYAHHNARDVFVVDAPAPGRTMPRLGKSNPSDTNSDVVVVWAPPEEPAPSPAPASKPAILTTDKKARKEMPMARGLVDYFPRALAAVAHVSFVANEQHNPGQPMHWSKGKSADHADCIMRHLVERGGIDDDGLAHSAKLAWRALANLETELEETESK